MKSCAHCATLATEETDEMVARVGKAPQTVKLPDALAGVPTREAEAYPGGHFGG